MNKSKAMEHGQRRISSLGHPVKLQPESHSTITSKQHKNLLVDQNKIVVNCYE